MTPLELLPLAMAEAQARLAHADGRWNDPTPCEGWTVRDLANHLVNGSKMSTTLLQGGTTEEAVAHFTADIGDDPSAAFAAASTNEHRAFAAASLETIVNHPRMPMPAAMMLNFRVSDYLLHAWDLARALGTDETLNAEVAQGVWDSLQPMAAMLPTTGAFGTGASGTMTDDAPLQSRLLDLTGRRP